MEAWTTYVVVIESVTDGDAETIVGPFPTLASAQQWGEDALTGASAVWSAVTLVNPYEAHSLKV